MSGSTPDQSRRPDAAPPGRPEPGRPPAAPLPVETALPALRRALEDAGLAVLHAPPGAGKTTVVPVALLDEPWLAGRRIVVLEPRRLAARAAARRMAFLLGEALGGRVGYRVRGDTRVGPRTRIEVVTEGVLTRMLQRDPGIEGVGVVVFDEFHERSLHADLGLALTLQARELLRPDLRLLVMSATLEVEPVAALLGDAPVVGAEGRAHPVEVRYLAAPRHGPLGAAVLSAVRSALADAPGDVLVFLPGAAEIRRAAESLAAASLGPDVLVAPLYGALSQEAQDRAIEPAPAGRRKVVLATAIAETSLTIEGVRAVVDAGLMRVPRFSPRTGLTRLATVTVTRASAEQRCGRAGRLGPGACYRLWSAAEQRQLAPHGRAEILDADLAPLALELAAWGTPDPAALRWLDPPPPAAYAQARELLAALGAVEPEPDGAITEHGRRMADLPVHPRLAHMLLRGRELGHAPLACALAALLEERDILRGEDAPADPDIRLRLDLLRRAAAGQMPAHIAGARVDRGGARRVLAEMRRLLRQLDGDGSRPPPARPAAPAAGEGESAGALLALAYPDRVARRREARGGRFLLRNGRGAVLPGAPGHTGAAGASAPAVATALATADYLVAADLDDRGAESRIYLAGPVSRDDIEALLGAEVSEEEEIAWDEDGGLVRALRRWRLGALVLREAPLSAPDPDAVRAALLDAIARAGVEALPWRREARGLRGRVAFLRGLEGPPWPDLSDAVLASTLETWLGPHVHGLRRREEVERLDLVAILGATLPWELRRRLDEEAPTHIVVPSGSRIPIDYADPQAPVLAVRLQEMFGLAETPRIARGRVPLTLHLLSPAHRPVQVTRDLASFWKEAYFEVRKDLRGRYPKHPWPEDPLAARATRRTKRRG